MLTFILTHRGLWFCVECLAQEVKLGPLQTLLELEWLRGEVDVVREGRGLCIRCLRERYVCSVAA